MKLEIYFDYLCEFCVRGHRDWSGLLPRYPQVEPVWMPVEAHPRASEPRYGMHSDLAIQGFLYLQEHGGDVAAYHGALFDAAWRRGENLEDVGVLSRYAQQAGADAAAFSEAVRARRYERELEARNAFAWGTLGLRAVPTYRFEDGRRLDAKLGVGVAKDELKRFLESV